MNNVDNMYIIVDFIYFLIFIVKKIIGRILVYRTDIVEKASNSVASCFISRLLFLSDCRQSVAKKLSEMNCYVDCL